jgi:type I restriction enzyme M protein
MRDFKEEPKGRLDFHSTLYVVGLAFLKYLSSKSKVSNDSSLRWSSRYVVPDKARWEVLRSDPTGEALVRGINVIESHPENTELGGVFSTLGLPELAHDPKLYRYWIDFLETSVKKPSSEDLPVMVDRLIEQGIRHTGWRAGEHYTPPDVTLLLADILNPQGESTIYDPACGTGSLLSACYSHAVRAGGVGGQPMLYGQEINPQTAALAKINTMMHADAPVSIATGNTLLAPKFVSDSSVQQFDYVIANPPLGFQLNPETLAQLRMDPFERFSYGVPKRTAELVFLEHVLASLKDTGRAAMTISPRALTIPGEEENLRRRLVESDLVEAVISLPARLLSNTDVSAAVIVLNKTKPRNLQGKVLFVFAEEEYEQGRSARLISEQQRQKIVGAVLQTREVPRFSVIIPIDRIGHTKYQLAPSRYVDIIGQDTFMGGSVRWMSLFEVGEIILGTRSRRRVSAQGNTPVIQGRNLSAPRIILDELEKVDLDDSSEPVYTETNDILIQRVGQRPRAYLVTEDLAGVLVRDSVHVVRLGERDGGLPRYVVDFLNSDPGQALLSLIIRGVGAPTLSPRNLRELSIPVPDDVVVRLISELHDVEQNLIDRIDAARGIRRRLFGIDDPEQVDAQLHALNVEAQVLAGSLVQVEELDFQVRNFFPYPLAYAYRTLSAIQEPTLLYAEQMRVVENILAFVATVGLSLAAHVGALARPDNTSVTSERLTGIWRGGISPGDWQALGRDSARLMRPEANHPAVDGFASLWFKGRGSRESDFARMTRELVGLRNAYAHNRGPATPYEFERSSKELQESIDRVLRLLSLFVQYPLRFVQDLNIDWRTSEAVLRTLLYTGDHPGLRQELVTLPQSLPKDKLYLTLSEDVWVPMYPLVNVQYCPQCGSRETYFIDGWNGPGTVPVLKSCERGHVFEDTDIGENIGYHIDHWMNTQFGSTDI